MTIAVAAKRIDDLEWAVAQVAGLHSHDRWAMGVYFCAECNHVWPCATRRALGDL